MFSNYSNGVKTNCDAWSYNTSQLKLSANINNYLATYNAESEKYLLSDKTIPIEKFVNCDPTLISWHSGILPKAARGIKGIYNPNKLAIALYRPFFKEWIYFDGLVNQRLSQMPSIFPNGEAKNLTISIVGKGEAQEFSALISDCLVDYKFHYNSQCFPLYLYEKVTQDKKVGSIDLFDNSLDLTVSETKYQRKDGLSDEGLKYFQDAYPNEQITKEDIFYYTYGLLHSEYRERYADNLTKDLPRIPCVKKAENFWAFSKAGRDLAHWHLNYETVEPYKATLDTGTKTYKELLAEDFYVEKMKFAKKGEKGTVIYNKRITIKDIPVEAYDYVVNGKPALEWVMERQGVSKHKDSGIVNDANDWAIETMNNPAYPLELFLRVITVSLETMKIVKGLPKLDI